MQEQMELEKKRKEEEKRIRDEKTRQEQVRIAAEQKERDRIRREQEAKNPADVQQNAYNFQGQMNNAEVNVRNKGFKDDEIYEGGDAIAQPSQVESSIAYDPSKEYINMDEYENAPGG
jgi:hypothetical protein